MAGKKKKVDKVAGPRSFLDQLRIRREMLESGDPEKAGLSMRERRKKKKGK